MFELNAIFELINPDNTVMINRFLIHALGLEETVLKRILKPEARERYGWILETS